jgi:hypothetical protein
VGYGGLAWLEKTKEIKNPTIILLKPPADKIIDKQPRQAMTMGKSREPGKMNRSRK